MSETIVTHGNSVVAYGNNIPGFNLFSGSFAIFSVRKVVDSYSGPAMRVLRTSDSTEQDINFIGNDLDTTSLLSFVGASNGYVSVWYDQSGNARHASSTFPLQMEIVLAGVLNTRGGKPAPRSTNSSIALYLPTTYNLGTNYSFLGVVEWSQRQKEWLGGGANMYGIYQDVGATYSSAVNGTYFQGSGEIPLNTNKIAEVYRTDLTAHTYYNNINLNTSLAINGGNLDFLLNSLNGENSTFGLVGYLQETIILTTNQLSRRTILYDNINNYFG